MANGIEDADAGHLHGEVAVLLGKVDDVAHKAVGMAARFQEAVAEVEYPDTPVGDSASRVVGSHAANRVGQMDSLVARLDALLASTRAAVQAQQEQDSDSAEEIAEAGHSV